MAGAVPDIEAAMGMSNARRMAVITIAKEIEQERTNRLIMAFAKAIGS